MLECDQVSGYFVRQLNIAYEFFGICVLKDGPLINLSLNPE